MRQRTLLLGQESSTFELLLGLATCVYEVGNHILTLLFRASHILLLPCSSSHPTQAVLSTCSSCGSTVPLKRTSRRIESFKYPPISRKSEDLPLTDDDTELAMIRRKKMAQLIKREKQLQDTKERQEKVDTERTKLLSRFLDPEATQYLAALENRAPAVAARIRDIVLYLITYRGIRKIFNQIDVRYIERQVTGEESKIRIQRDGETSDFGDYVKEALKKGGPTE